MFSIKFILNTYLRQDLFSTFVLSFKTSKSFDMKMFSLDFKKKCNFIILLKVACKNLHLTNLPPRFIT